MPYTLKTSQISVKDPETGEYSGVDILAEQTEEGLIAELQAEGTKQVNRINQAAVDVQAAVDQAESDAATIISDTQTSINALEAQKNTIAQTVASMAELGTDTTLSTPGMAADAGAVGDLSRQISDFDPLYSTLMEQGSISAIAVGSPLRLNDDPNYIRTANFSPWEPGMSVYLKDGFEARLLLCDSNGNYIIDASWSQNPTSSRTADLVKVVVRRQSLTAITPDEIISAIVSTDIPLTTVYRQIDDAIPPLEYGAKYDGITDCTMAIQKAINNANGKIVRFSGNGTAIIRQPIVIKENTHIVLDKGFTLKLADDTNCPMFKNAPSDLNYNDSQAGENIQNNISIVGGILDFNGNNQTWQNTNYRLSAGVVLCDVNNLLISDVELIDPITFGIFLNGITNFTIKNIFCNYSNQHNNMDGIHLGGGCGYGTIENIYGTSNDDFIALNSGDRVDINALLRIGATHDIVIKNIKGKNAYRAIRLLAGNTNYSELLNISIDGIYGSYRYGAVLLSTYTTSTRAYYRNISIKNVICDGLTHNDLIIFQGNYTETSTLLAESISIENVFSRQNEGIEANLINVTAQSTISNLIINNVLLTSTDIDLSSKYFITGNGTINGLIISNVEIRKPTINAGMRSVNSTLTKTAVEVSNFILNGKEVGYLPGEHIPISGQWYGTIGVDGDIIGLLVTSVKTLPAEPITTTYVPNWIRSSGIAVTSGFTLVKIERLNDHLMNIVYSIATDLPGMHTGVGLLDTGSYATF